MRRDVINVPALHAAIDCALEGLPPALHGQRRDLGGFLRRSVVVHPSVRKARRRRTDPAWAQARFAEGATLYRFDESRYEELRRDMDQLVEALAQIAALAHHRDGPLASQAAAFLRGTPHRRGAIDELTSDAMLLASRGETMALKARRGEILRSPALHEKGLLTGARCRSIGEIIRLGRHAGNCLSHQDAYWRRFLQGDGDFWALYQNQALVAALEVEAKASRVVQILGPRNAAVPLERVQPLVQWCLSAGLTIGASCEAIRPEFAEPYLIEPRAIHGRNWVAQYAEWRTAVRIDVHDRHACRLLDFEPVKRLALTFDPERSCVTELLGGSDLQDEIDRIGKKVLRKIVRNIALGQESPTLAQHRLLALAV